MRRTLLGVLAILGVAGSGLAVAHNASAPTDLGFRTSVGTQESNALVGVLDSEVAKCVRGRTVVLWRVESDNTRTRLDVDKTSSGGAWAVVGDFSGAIDGRVKVLPKNIGSGTHRHICAGQVFGAVD